ncbi:MAG: gluconokinase [Micrococcales bacterium]|nr:gluconokinase [Micrococcales bacterium]
MDSPAQRSAPPDIIVVMGVSGSGKSTVARAVAATMGWDFAEGDNFHSASNVAKMHSGHPLTDADRWPWLEAIGDWISAQVSRGESGVVTCSALRRAYRDLLRQGRPAVRFLDVSAPEQTIEGRMQHRSGHFMPPSLLPSQLATLEPLGPDEPGVEVTTEGTPDQVLERSLEALGLRKPG